MVQIVPSIAIGTTAFLLLTYRGWRNNAPSTNRVSNASSSNPPGDIVDTDTGNYQTTLTRLMLPDDANPAGNVHGGTILKLMEMSAYILANRHGNLPKLGTSKTPTTAVLASIASCTFLQPMHVGDISHVKVKILSTYSSSMLISVHVYREDIRHGDSSLIKTNEAHLWYVRVDRSRTTGFKRHRTFQPCHGIRKIVPMSKADIQTSQKHRQRSVEQRSATTRDVYNPLLDPTNVIIARLGTPGRSP